MNIVQNKESLISYNYNSPHCPRIENLRISHLLFRGFSLLFVFVFLFLSSIVRGSKSRENGVDGFGRMNIVQNKESLISYNSPH